MLAYSQPFLRLTKRLSGTVALAGWDGVLSMEGDANILLKDDDLFPVGSVKSQGIKTFNGTPLERVTGLHRLHDPSVGQRADQAVQ